MRKIEDLKVKIFADGAELDGIRKLAANPYIKGFTTNPTLMRKAGVKDYAAHAKQIIAAIPDSPVALEVFADDLPTIEKQARVIAGWGKNVNVKVPVTTTKGEFLGPVIKSLSASGVMVNVTALMTLKQVEDVTACLSPDTPSIVSVFAGRVADAGRDPVPLMAEAVRIMKAKPKSELIWASPRELFNIFQADDVGCHIITVSHDVLAKLSLVGKDLDVYSLETVKMFHADATAAGYSIAV
jgi:transaldolase